MSAHLDGILDDIARVRALVVPVLVSRTVQPILARIEECVRALDEDADGLAMVAAEQSHDIALVIPRALPAACPLCLMPADGPICPLRDGPCGLEREGERIDKEDGDGFL